MSSARQGSNVLTPIGTIGFGARGAMVMVHSSNHELGSGMTICGTPLARISAGRFGSVCVSFVVASELKVGWRENIEIDGFIPTFLTVSLHAQFLFVQ